MVAYLAIHPVREEDFPPKLAKDYSWIIAQLTRRESVSHKGEIQSSRVEESLRRMRNSTGVKIAERIVNLCNQLKDHLRK